MLSFLSRSTLPPNAEQAPTAGAAPARLLSGYSIEVTGADQSVGEACDASLPAGTQVFIAFVPGESPARVIEAARRLRRAGLIPVPHIIARSVADRGALDRLLGSLASVAGVTAALVLAGDRPQAAGPFHSSLQLLETGLFQQHGVTDLAFACHPEGHPSVDAATMRAALRDKLAYASDHGLRPRLVSQFTLDAAPIAPCLERLRVDAPDVPIRIGIAGPTSRKTLLKYAVYCGVGNTLRAVGRHAETLSHLVFRADPDALLAALAQMLADWPEPLPAVEGVHIFTFGGVAKAVAWAEGIA